MIWDDGSGCVFLEILNTGAVFVVWTFYHGIMIFLHHGEISLYRLDIRLCGSLTNEITTVGFVD